MFAILTLALVALLVARVAGAPPGSWRWILAAALLALLASQALPPGHPLRADIAGSARALAWLALVAAPVAAYALWIRSLRRRSGLDRPPATHPVGLVQIAEDASLVADTAAAIEAETRAAGAAGPTLSLGWRTPDGVLAGHLRMRQTGRTGEIEALWVAPGQRRQGIGSRLLAAVAGEARARGLERLAAAPGSWQAPGFFARTGFAVVAERPLGQGFARVWMERELT